MRLGTGSGSTGGMLAFRGERRLVPQVSEYLVYKVDDVQGEDDVEVAKSEERIPMTMRGGDRTLILS